MEPSAQPLIANVLLNMLPAEELKRFKARLEPVKMNVRDVLLVDGAPVKAAYFLQSGVISMIKLLEDGTRIEVGIAGKEGMVGLPLLLGADTSSVEAMVQVEGEALRLPAEAFRQALGEAPALMPLLLRYVDTFNVQVSQTAACNSRHQIEQRLARWLLMTRDRVEADSFVMTQEFMSTLLGVRRPGVTLAIGALQRAGLAQHQRGVLRVIDRPGLEAAACECYQTVSRRYAWLRPPVGLIRPG